MAATALGALSGASCDGASNAPSPFGRAELTNLKVSQLGLRHAFCGGGFQYVVYDELVFDIIRRPASTYLGATLHSVLDDGTDAWMGSVTQCPEDLTACASPSAVCLTASSDGGGRIRAYASVPWTPVRTWRVFLRSGEATSNVVQADIARPDGLPFGNVAAIAFIEARRSSGTTTLGSYSLQAYSPGVAGRRITLRYEVWANGVQLSSHQLEILETRVETKGLVGGISIAPGPTELVGLLEERDVNGNLIATDRKIALFQ
jgi:hypothetical protein